MRTLSVIIWILGFSPGEMKNHRSVWEESDAFWFKTELHERWIESPEWKLSTIETMFQKKDEDSCDHYPSVNANPHGLFWSWILWQECTSDFPTWFSANISSVIWAAGITQSASGFPFDKLINVYLYSQRHYGRREIQELTILVTSIKWKGISYVLKKRIYYVEVQWTSCVIILQC